ncbi:MAG: FtsX-like permease family protein [Bacteroidetes bacterium]|nr:FtsX-like permease family protein [Bacteroidota bacterium]
MFQNNFKIAFRRLWRHKSFSLLNIVGLSVGLGCAGMILLWAEDELTFDGFHEKKDRLFQVVENQRYEDKTYTFYSIPGKFASAVKAEIPEVAQAVRVDWGNNYAFSLGDKNTFEPGYLVDSNFLEVFDFPLVEGDAKKALNQTNSLLVTERMAKKFFGEENPIGKTLKVNNKEDFTIAGVLQDLPENSTLKFDWLASFRIYEKQNSWWEDWGTNCMQTFVLLNSASDSGAVNRKFKDFIQQKQEGAAAKPWLMPYSDLHLRSEIKDGRQTGNGRIEYVRLFGIIAAFILLIACFNYMNLTTARSENRSREVGVRKVIGAGQSTLTRQFLSEAMLTAAIAMLVAIGIMYVSLPAFNALVDKELSLNLTNPLHWGSMLAVVLVTGLLAGSYPSFYLASAKPIQVLKGVASTFRKPSDLVGATSIRKGLVVMQFCVSVFLIICSIVVYNQIDHIKNRHLGFDKSGLVYVGMNNQSDNKFDVMRHDMLATGVVENVAQSSDGVLNIGSSSGRFSWPGKDPSMEKLISLSITSPGFVSTLGMELQSGRDFEESELKDSTSVIINETFAKLIRKDSKVDELVGTTIRDNEKDLRIVGVVKDFQFGNMYAEPEPLMYFGFPPSKGVYFIRFKPGQDVSKALASVESIFQKYNPGFPFDYKFLDDEFDKLFRSETTVGRLSMVFTGLAIFICCLGLFGLAAFAAERRRKEIGVRKVLGASTSGIVGLLSKEFLSLVILSLLISSPLAWYAVKNWLDDFEYHVQIHWWVFALAGLIALSIAFLTISFQSIKAAVANPVKSLRSE